MGKRLELVANVVLIVIAVLVGYTFIKARYLARPEAPNQVQVGNRLQPIKGWMWDRNKQTVVIAMKKDCHYCQESVPFYKTLAEAWRNSCGNHKTGLVAVLPDSAALVQKFLGEQSLEIPAIPEAQLADLGVNVTPTTLLVDRNGEVLKTWTGMLSPKKELEVLEQFKQNSGREGRCE